MVGETTIPSKTYEIAAAGQIGKVDRSSSLRPGRSLRIRGIVVKLESGGGELVASALALKRQIYNVRKEEDHADRYDVRSRHRIRIERG